MKWTLTYRSTTSRKMQIMQFNAFHCSNMKSHFQHEMHLLVIMWNACVKYLGSSNMVSTAYLDAHVGPIILPKYHI